MQSPLSTSIAASPEPLTLRLRSATAEQHRELEALVKIDQMLATPARYEQLLTAFYGFYLPFEARLGETALAEVPELEPSRREKTAWLTRDLCALGVQDFSSIRLCPDLMPLGDRSQILGALYVVEGSTLGGRHISHQLEQSGIPHDARHFFNSYGDQVGPMWKKISAIINQLDEESCCLAAIESARRTFDCLRRWLGRNVA